MGEYRPLRWGIFVYDVLRLIVMLETALVFVVPANGPGGAFFPLSAYMAPNALFPIMALLLCLRPDEHGAYVLLYIAGKIVGVMANLGWLVFSFKNGALNTAVYGDFSSRIFLGWAFVMLLFDGLSVLGGFTLNRGRIKAARIAEGEP
jgi:hypothetical protein